MKVKCFDIIWDDDGKGVFLPKEMIIDLDDDSDPSLEAADVLSDEVGYCVESFNFEVINEH